MKKKLIPDLLKSWSEYYRELYEERAAIMEFECGYSRELAERVAFKDIEYLMKNSPIRESRDLPCGPA